MQIDESKSKKRDDALHLIMFSDSSKTLNVELKRWHLWLITGIFCVMIVFSASSVYFVIKSYRFYDTTIVKTMEYKNAIAQYQIKYEGLYEKAYEGQAVKDKPKKGARKAIPIAEKKVAPAPSDTPAKSESDTALIKLAAKGPTEEAHVSYEIEAMKVKSDELFVKLKVANSDREKKREGYIAVVSVFKDKDGNNIYSTWPSRVQVDNATGEIKDISQANRYVIRAFKYETINFPKPLTTEGKFEKVMIVISEEGKGVRKFDEDVK